MIKGKANPEFNGGADSFVVYYDGLPASETIDASQNPRETVKNMIRKVNKEIVKSNFSTKTYQS